MVVILELVVLQLFTQEGSGQSDMKLVVKYNFWLLLFDANIWKEGQRKSENIKGSGEVKDMKM